jgi:hypothetical protein
MTSSHHIKITMGTALAVLSIAAPAALARPDLNPPTPTPTATPKPAATVDLRNPDTRDAELNRVLAGVNRQPGIQTARQPAQVVRVSDHSGFDWGDAGIGAAGGLGLAMLGLGGAIVVSQRRSRRDPEVTPSTS